MPRGKSRNYPPVSLERAVKVAQVIAEGASGQDVSRLTLAELLSTTPASSGFRDLLGASRMFGLTSGGVNHDVFGLTQLGEAATGADEVARAAALKQAVRDVEPYGKFLSAYADKKIPLQAPLAEFLQRDGGVDPGRVAECIEFMLADLEFAGLLREIKGSKWVDASGGGGVVVQAQERPDKVAHTGDPEPGDDVPADEHDLPRPSEAQPGGGAEHGSGQRPKKVFIAHGKNRTPLDQLKKALDQFKVQYAVAVDEPHRGRPISEKVANLMSNDCSSGIFIFTSDERFLREDPESGGTQEVWRPSENVVFELGAASILYDKRIVIFKEKGVQFPSDFSDLGYIEFEKDQLVAEIGTLFQELVGLDVLEVRAKG